MMLKNILTLLVKTKKKVKKKKLKHILPTLVLVSNYKQTQMSALQQVLNCEDLRGIIRQYQQPHPVAVIIEYEYYEYYLKNMRRDIKKIMEEARIIECDGRHQVKFSFEKDYPFENYITINRWLYLPVIVPSLKRLRYVKDGLNIKYKSFFDVFDFKEPEFRLTNIGLSIIIENHLENANKYSGKEYKYFRSEFDETQYEIHNLFCKRVIEDYKKIYEEKFVNRNLYCQCEYCCQDV
jgi:hypothetical protein